MTNHLPRVARTANEVVKSICISNIDRRRDDKVAKIRGHEARVSLLGGQPSTERTYEYQPYAGGYHHREGLGPYTAGAGLQTTSRMHLSSSKWTWAFVGVTGAQAAIVLALEA